METAQSKVVEAQLWEHCSILKPEILDDIVPLGLSQRWRILLRLGECSRRAPSKHKKHDNQKNFSS